MLKQITIKSALAERSNVADIVIRPRKIAVVSRNCCNAPYTASLLREIAKLCDEQKCDTILYAPWTYNHQVGQNLRKNTVFGKTKRLRNVLLEIGVRKDNSCKSTRLAKAKQESLKNAGLWRTEVWNRNLKRPATLYQRFSRSADSQKQKRQFIADFSNRKFGPTFVVLCGETNTIRTKRATKRIVDEFRILSLLEQQKVRYILNPVHTYMFRPEMNRKRKAFSADSRYVISVWNTGRPPESRIPWKVFFDKRDITDRVSELESRIAGRQDIRIGILKLDQTGDELRPGNSVILSSG